MVTWHGEHRLGTVSSLYRWHFTTANPLTASLPLWPRPHPQPTNGSAPSAFDVNQSQHLFIKRASTAGCSLIYKRFPSEWHGTKNAQLETQKFEREIESNIKNPQPFWGSLAFISRTHNNNKKLRNLQISEKRYSTGSTYHQQLFSSIIFQYISAQCFSPNQMFQIFSYLQQHDFLKKTKNKKRVIVYSRPVGSAVNHNYEILN